MPVYATLEDMLARYSEAELVQLTDDAGAGTVDEARVDASILAASSMADGYIASAYKLPIDPVPAFVVDAVCAIARFRLYRDSPTDPVKAERDAAVRTLKDIAAGTLKIDSGVEEQIVRPGAILVEGAERVFSRERMKGF